MRAPLSEVTAVFAEHGGNLAAAQALFPSAPHPWIDLSTGVNPQSYPLPQIDLQTWTRLPDRGALGELEAAAAARYGVEDAQCVVAGPGSQAIIQALTRMIAARRVGVLGLTYSGHAKAWRAAGASVAIAQALHELAGLDVAVVVNPNNPDGRIVSHSALESLNARVGLLVVDEAFVDLETELESYARAMSAQTLILRSFGKTYGLAGLRLGFAISSPKLAKALRHALGEWPVSGPAIAIGRQALADDEWLRDAQARAAAAAERLDAMLLRAGYGLIGGTRLFRLATHPQAKDIFSRLLSRGILVRPFAERPDWLRLGLPGSEAHWQRLAIAIGA